jgi:hypothetical protein
MHRLISRLAAACTIVFVLSVAGVSAADRSAAVDSQFGFKGSQLASPQRNFNLFSFKLRGGGQIDLNTLEISFAGQASFMGQFTAAGLLDPATGAISGTITTANGDTVNWTGAFFSGPDGDIQATVTFVHGTGRFAHFNGEATGPVTLDADDMFSISLDGSIYFNELG